MVLNDDIIQITADFVIEKRSRLLLCTAAAQSLKWEWEPKTKRTFVANMPAVYEVDGETELEVFMLAAVGEGSDLEAVYRLLREYPTAIARA